MIGLSGTESDKSLFTRIFSPPGGILMCWYAIGVLWGFAAEKGCDYTVVNRPAGRALKGWTGLWSGPFTTTGEGDYKMKQLLTVLVAAMFAAVSVGAIAQDKGKTEAKKEMSKDGKTSTKSTKTKKSSKKTADKKAAADKK